MNTLAIHNLSHAFGGLKAITDFSLEINKGEIVAIIGPNGAGKTTLFNILCGLYPLQKGKVYFNQQSLGGFSPYKITRLGVARTFQNIRLFKTLTVLDNIRTATTYRYRLTAMLLRRSSFYKQEQNAFDEAYTLLTRFGLEQYSELPAHQLPYGLQRRLEIARALATHPQILLLDEPACGMNPNEANIMAKLIKEIQSEQQLAILLIDHQMPFVMSLAQRIFVLNFGKTIATGDPETIRNHAEVIESYLGSTI